MREDREVMKLFLNFRQYGIKSEQDLFFQGTAKAERTENITELTVDAVCEGQPYDFQKVMCSEYAAFVELEIEEKIEGALSRVQYNPFWSRPCFETDLSKIPENIQNLLLKTENCFIAVLPLNTENLCAYISPSEHAGTLRIKISSYYEGMDSIKGTFAVLCEDENPHAAIRHAYEYALQKGYMCTPLKEEKKLPKIYQELGWCTWNACYHEVTEQIILEKVKEMREKKVPLKWIMIDDGWFGRSEKNPFQITSFYEDINKFPNGLRGCIEKLKKEYGIEQVGVWHSFTGYWYGVERNSPLEKVQRKNLTETNTGYLIPEGEKSYDFYKNWYVYLKGQGVDFVKIDCQGNALEFLKGQKDCVIKVKEMQLAAERAAQECFGGNVINCMGLHNLNALNRPYTMLIRSSDDFYPKDSQSFQNHLEQNIYNAVFMKDLYYCDFDMWWTEHETAKQSAILRMISGGPIYLSDELGHTDFKALEKITDEEGKLFHCDDIALPTEECLFGHDGIVKVFNQCNGKKVEAVFNLTEKAVICENVKIGARDAEIIWEGQVATLQ